MPGKCLAPFRASTLDAAVPILLGMDLLTNMLEALVDCGRGAVALATLVASFWERERLPGGRLAVCLTSPRCPYRRPRWGARRLQNRGSA